MWLDLETSVAILCACLPVMRPLIHPKQFWQTNRTRTVTAATDYNEMPEQPKKLSGQSDGHSHDGSGGYNTSGSESGMEEGKLR